MLLIGKDLWKIVNGSEVIDEDATAEEKRNFKKRENRTIATVCLSVSTNLQNYIRSVETGKEAWDSLANYFQQKTLSRNIQLRRKLYSMKLEKGCDMVEHINAVKTIAEHLEAIGDSIAEHDLVIILISILNDEFNFLITALETIAEDTLTWAYVRDRLLHEAEKTKTPTLKDKGHDALFTKQNYNNRWDKKSKDLLCHYCKEKNPFARDCAKKKTDEKATKEKANLANEQKPTPEIALKSNHTANGNERWIDSGASQHMTFDRKSIVNFQNFEQPLSIQLADNSQLHSYGKGQVRITMLNGKEKVDILLNVVLYVPKSRNKLFSLPPVTDKGATVEFGRQSCSIKIKNENYTIGQKHGKLYKLNTVNESCYVTQAQQPMDLWHK